MSVRCKHCGRFLSENHSGSCPSCGKSGKVVSILVQDGIAVSDSAQYTSIREYYEKNIYVFALVIVITILSSIIGLFVAGFAGILGGLVLGALSLFLGSIAATKVKEITNG